MRKNNFIKASLFMMLIGSTLPFTSCKKEGCTDSAATNYDSEAKKDDQSCTYPPVVTVCIEDEYNGTYTGAGTVNSVPSSNMTLVFTKLTCVTCTIESGSVTENVVDIEESSAGGYRGLDDDGNTVSFTLDSGSLSVSSDEISFN